MIGSRMEAAHEAARLYRSIGALPERLLRPEIHRAWERAHALGVDPRLARAEALGPRDTALLVERHAPLVAAATPYLHALSRASGEHAHAAMLGDASGVVLACVGDEQTVGRGEHPTPGTLLNDATTGANGVGTPLAEGRYVEVVGPEHFIEGYRDHACQGVPLHDGTGRVVGALGTSMRHPEASRRLREMLQCAARGIEAELLRASLEARLAGVLADPSPTHQVLERLYLDLVGEHASARMRLELASQQLRCGLTVSAADVLKLALRALNRYHREAAFWRALASPEKEQPPASFALDEATRDLAILLDGEAAAHHSEILLREIEPVTVHADPVALRSALLRSFLAALAQGRGGAVIVDVRRHRTQGEVSLSPQPGPDTLHYAPAPIVVTATLAPVQQSPTLAG
jgi:transcriptional regulator of acetoin/glycerol metabolism